MIFGHFIRVNFSAVLAQPAHNPYKVASKETASAGQPSMTARIESAEPRAYGVPVSGHNGAPPGAPPQYYNDRRSYYNDAPHHAPPPQRHSGYNENPTYRRDDTHSYWDDSAPYDMLPHHGQPVPRHDGANSVRGASARRQPGDAREELHPQPSQRHPQDVYYQDSQGKVFACCHGFIAYLFFLQSI
jgi:hypothetical protein